MDLPDWAVEMSNGQWAELVADPGRPGHTNCEVCGARLLLTLCRYEGPFYCFEHCPGHEWQSDYDWSTECGRCGVIYSSYLESVLDENGVEYQGLRRCW